MSDIVIVVESRVVGMSGRSVFLTKGEEYPSDAPVVQAWPDLFIAKPVVSTIAPPVKHRGRNA